ncbi:Mur ligase family protein [Campylobacter sp. RM16192]|uniref:Mur ligase family protein n=1 Tax=Campylobacter sp. RM16192 TaxID=1660080 RepID=UPI001451E93C|nr:UDP-N-acetylmuramoyl-tripeptide--D-alanyl-D-alanine ligase [Campylobacter sp. RM16192]QCD52578.1 D-alanyl-D-alanine-adding enzyme [Campylobacter sp. RM16192]
MSENLTQILIQSGLVASHILFTLALGFYLITCLQWFSYKFERVFFHFTKPVWHVFFAIIPIVLYYTTSKFFWIYFYFAMVPSLYLWHKKLDKKLVFTPRVKRFFSILALALVLENVFCFISAKCQNLGIILPLVLSFILSFILEKMNFKTYEKAAIKNLKEIKELKIILITASFGKTSIKNFLFEILKDDFRCHKTPRSVNTLAGLIQDVNNNLAADTQIYIAEAGARLKGDIAEITAFLQPQIVIVGEIGAQHIEYFKTLDNIRSTKLEALGSKRLEKAFVHSSTLAKESEKVEIFDKNLKDIKANLEGINFSLDEVKFSSPLLGKFNCTNLAVCVKTALYLGLEPSKVQNLISKLKNVEHRLQRIDAGGKIIIDDSFNGNFNGMSVSYELVSGYEGRKVLITPGIVESTAEENKKLSKIINETFDVVMISSSLNAVSLLKYLTKPKIIIIKDKSKMQEILAQNTKAGDLILFSNDAPSFM